MSDNTALPLDELVGALVADPVFSPERTNASPARVREVLGLVLEDEKGTERILGRLFEAVGPIEDENAPLSDAAGLRAAATLIEELDGAGLERVAELLWLSEIATDEVVRLHRAYKIPVSRLEDDLLPVRGEGALIWDSLGREYVDLDANYSATNLGNANEAVARGLYNQASLLISQKEDRIGVARARFLREIAPMMPGELHHFYWQNSGGEAVDKALKIAKAYTDQRGVVAFTGGFHGRTHGAVAVTHNEAHRRPFGLHQEDWVHFVEWGELAAVERLFDEGKARIVILELVQGEEAGIRPATPEFALGLRELCDRYDAVLIADEVQTGFARTAAGEGQWFASHRYEIVPDIITLGKSFGGGYPVTAVATGERIARAMRPGYDGSTFGGTPMAMTAALIATRQMRRLNLPTRVAELSARIKDGLEAIKKRRNALGDTRIVGLMLGIDLDGAERVARVQERMKRHGVHSSLSTGKTMRWLPPLVITDKQVEKVLEAFDRALGELE